jgi:hypothetical protein
VLVVVIEATIYVIEEKVVVVLEVAEEVAVVVEVVEAVVEVVVEVVVVEVVVEYKTSKQITDN